MPAVIGVVFVFLVGVVVWVIASSGDADDEASNDDASGNDGSAAVVTEAPSTATTVPTASTPPPTLSPTPLPSTVPPTTAPPATSAPTTEPAAPVTTAPGAPEGAVPGDLAIAGQAMQRPPCDGSYITVLASAVGGQATAGAVASVLEQYEGANYLRTDQTCPSLTPDVGGEPIYVIYFGPFAFDSDACAARADGPVDAYARQLSSDLGPGHSVSCADV